MCSVRAAAAIRKRKAAISAHRALKLGHDSLACAHTHKHRQAQDEGAAEEETAAVRANAIVEAAGKSFVQS
jgi:hypothetical protein